MNQRDRDALNFAAMLSDWYSCLGCFAFVLFIAYGIGIAILGSVEAVNAWIDIAIRNIEALINGL